MFCGYYILLTSSRNMAKMRGASADSGLCTTTSVLAGSAPDNYMSVVLCLSFLLLCKYVFFCSRDAQKQRQGKNR